MSTENNPLSSALAHLDGLLDEALEQTFPASDAVAIDIEHTTTRHEFSIPACCPLATGRWPDGVQRNTIACSSSVRTT
jgi:hypothetical protein